MKKLNHIELFESFMDGGFSTLLELPEGYGLAIFGTDEESLMREFHSSDYHEEAYGSFEVWKEDLVRMGKIEYPSGDGKFFFRGKIEWEPMGINYIYELHPY